MDTRADCRQSEKGRTAQLNLFKTLLHYLGAILAAPRGNQKTQAALYATTNPSPGR
jgi:hypothetical protein